jgi:uncharacterized membrane protein
MAFCSACGGQVADGVTVCPACGHSTAATAPVVAAAPAAQAGSGLTDNVAGMLAYFTFIPAVLFLVLEPYNKNRFIRFHAFQCLFLYGAAIACWIALMIVSVVLAFIPIVGHLVSFLLWMALSFGLLIVWIIVMIKAYQGQTYKLPVIGDLAEKQANA